MGQKGTKKGGGQQEENRKEESEANTRRISPVPVNAHLLQ
jgi:hypothetical protein